MRSLGKQVLKDQKIEMNFYRRVEELIKYIKLNDKRIHLKIAKLIKLLMCFIAIINKT